MAVSIPQEDPLQPGPERENASTVLGFEPGTGVIMATIVADVPAGTLDGAVSCKEKLLVMVSVVDTRFAGSAALCAVTVALGGAGSICGAV